MRLDRNALLKVIETATGSSPPIIAAPEHFEKWVSERKLPEELSQFLLTTAFSTEVIVGPIAFCDFGRICEWDQDFPHFIQQGFLCVGTVLDGDFVMIHFHDQGRTGILSHDGSYWEEKADLSSMFTAVADSIGEFAKTALQEV